MIARPPVTVTLSRASTWRPRFGGLSAANPLGLARGILALAGIPRSARRLLHRPADEGFVALFEPNTRVVFSKDSRSRIIDLPGNKRVIKRVEFKYRDLPGGGKAKVELWGANPATPR